MKSEGDKAMDENTLKIHVRDIEGSHILFDTAKKIVNLIAGVSDGLQCIQSILNGKGCDSGDSNVTVSYDTYGTVLRALIKINDRVNNKLTSLHIDTCPSGNGIVKYLEINHVDNYNIVVSIELHKGSLFSDTIYTVITPDDVDNSLIQLILKECHALIEDIN